MAVLTGVLAVALLGALASRLYRAADRSERMGRLVAVVARAGLSAPFMGRETLGDPTNLDDGKTR